MENQPILKWYQKPVTVILFLIFFFPVGLYLMWKHDLWNKTTRVIVSVFFGLIVVSNMNKGNNVLSHETTYEFNENGVYALIHLTPKDEYGNMGKNSVAGDCMYGFRVNGINSDFVKGSFVINEKRILFDWRGLGPKEGIFEKDYIKITGPEGIAIYKITE